MKINFQNNNTCGFLVLEVIIALGLFSICVFSTISLSFGARRMYEEAHARSLIVDAVSEAMVAPTTFGVELTKSAYGNDSIITVFSSSTGNASQNIFGSSSISISILEPDTFSAYGKDTCLPILNLTNEAHSTTTSYSLPILSSNLVTGLVVKDGFAYISTNSNSQADPDLFIFDLRDTSSLKSVSSLNTGPGLDAISVAGPYIYAANDSSTNQLQVIDIHDRFHPSILSQVKVPLDIASSTRPYASAVFYDKGFVYLGTQKGDSPELTIWNVADPAHPTLAGRYELGNKVERILVSGTIAYIAGTDADQLVSLDISNPANPFLLATASLPGWQTQSGQALDLFLGALALGRDTGGYNSIQNPEFILFDASSDPKSQLVEQGAFDEPGGIYGIVARPPHFIILTRRSSNQLRFVDKFGTTSATYSIPGVPVALSCDWENLYVASNNGPAITAIKNFHE